jgi:isoleucyl-tRNA synthetase
MAPGFGEDDKASPTGEGIELVVPVDKDGRFTAEVDDYAGSRSSTPTRDHHPDLKAGGSVVVLLRTRPTTTPTRTAGAADSR